MNELSKTVGELGVKQFVRNIFLEKVKAHMGKPEDTEKVISEINEEIFIEFRKLAKEEITQLIKEISTLLNKQEAIKTASEV